MSIVLFVAIKIKCPRCEGAGEIELSEDLMKTLKALNKPATADKISEVLGWCGHTTAINNRLEDLRALGFVSRTRIGRCWLYSKV